MIDFISGFFSWGNSENKEIKNRPKRKKLNKKVVTEVKQEEE